MVRTTGLSHYSDVHYTHPAIAKAIVDHFNPKGDLLEPFSGGGAFLDLMPGADWCEIEKGKDFFSFHDRIDWIVTNPPYSNLTEVMEHSFGISKNTVFLLPLSKVYSSSPRIKLVRDKAGIKEQLNLGSGRDIGFDSGFPFAAIHFESGYQGPTKNSWVNGKAIVDSFK